MKFQIEHPCEQDLFESSGHSHAANAIKQVILNQSDIHAIGLEGELGSGKSTVLRLLEHQLPEEKYKFIIFDVEQFHYSSTKASFIKHLSENFIHLFGSSDNKIEKKVKKKILEATDKALGNDLTYTKKIKSNISWYTVSFAISLMFSVRYAKESISNVFNSFNHLLSNTSSYSFGLDETITTLLGLSPLAVIATMYMQKRKERDKSEEDQKIPNIGDIFKRNSKDTITEKLQVTREVGVSELKAAFQKLVEIIPDDKCIILIIDNLDRVDKEKVREVWSDLEIFTSFGGDNLRVIVPFSEKHVSAALSDDDTDGSEFILKRLPVKFRTPPIVSAGWRKPFEQYWTETLSSYDGIELCSELIDIWISSTKQITPRFLKNHINEIAATLSSNPENISTIACSAYLLAQKSKVLSFKDVISTTLSNDNDTILLTHKVLRKVMTDDDWSSQIMSIHYQTTISVAKSELLETPLKRSLLQYDAENVIELSKLFGFDIAFQRLMGRNDPYEFVQLASEADINDERHKIWIDKWIPQINLYLEQYKKVCLGYNSSIITSYKKLLNDNITLSKARLEAEHNNIKNEISDNTSEDISLDERLLQLYEIETIISNKFTPDFIKKPKMDYFLNTLWPYRDNFPLWQIELMPRDMNLVSLFNIINKKTFHETNELILEISTFFKLGAAYFSNVDKRAVKAPHNTQEYEFDSEDYPQILISSDFSTQSGTKNILVELEKNLESQFVDQWVAICIVSAIASNSLDVSYKNSTIIDYLIDNFYNEKSQLKHIENFLPFAQSYKSFLEQISNEELPIGIKKIICNSLANDRIHAMNIENITNDYYSGMKPFIKNVSKTLSSMTGWKHNLKDGAVTLWEPEFIIDCLQLNNEWKDYIINWFDSKEHKKNYWLKLFTQCPEQMITIINWYNKENKSIKNSSEITTCLIDNYKILTDTDTDSNQNLFNSIFQALPTNSSSRIKRALSDMLIKEQIDNEDKYLIIERLSDYVSLPDFESEASKNTIISLIENITTQHVVDWLDNQYKCLGKVDWSNKEETLSHAISSLDEQFKIDNLKSFVLQKEHTIEESTQEEII
ncbi:hypothetical protein GNP80_08445 [Aliivibrio fischeri]|uniref:P-loop NTPase fold protein n=1 Tax=Aliivibrio fischeri TaxID=668 RepID=UPI0012D998E8|nr:P-loop NTPase fold protein [Aliivibrio fischeri]MUK92470.1 hypothetical protein [Aliivibrio fischeri]